MTDRWLETFTPLRMLRRLEYLKAITSKESLETIRAAIDFAYVHDQEFADWLGVPRLEELNAPLIPEREKS